MGDTEGEGMEMRWEPMEVDAGVGSSEPEPDDEDDTETDLARPRAPRGMVMGAVGMVFLSLEAMLSGGRKEGARPATREALYAVESPLL